MNIPNLLTIFRIFLVPVLVVIILTRFEDWEVFGVCVFLVAAATDWLDGFLARRWQQITLFGKLIDPIADKILIAAAFISLVEAGPAKAWMVILIVGRDFAVDGLRLVAQSQSVTIHASRLGKIKTVAQIFCIVILILNGKLGRIAEWVGARIGVPDPEIWGAAVVTDAGFLMLLIVVAISLLSGIDYFQRFYRSVDLTALAGGA